VRAPVALFFFNRPAPLARVFAALRRARPSRLFLVADGPRASRPGEAAAVEAARRVVAKVDWPCQVRRLYAESNLGCGARVSSGIDWVFRQTAEAAILEDDCLPTQDFFRYAAHLLRLYRKDERVQTIGGSNFLEGTLAPGADWGFSRYPMIWGWATWRRAWRHYDRAMPGWPQEETEVLGRVFREDAKARLMWGANLWAAYEGRLDTWDYQWIWSIWRRQGLAVVPARNLISNIGAGPGATHGENRSPFAFMALGRLGPKMRAPREVAADQAFDEAMERQAFSGQPVYGWTRVLRWRARRLGRALGLTGNPK
jgi:hypothetical protein